MNKCPIGVMDSGVGGLSVLNELLKFMPRADYLYFGDTLNLPYGCKTKEQVHSYNKNILNFFLSMNIKDVVIACNTTSALTYDELKEEFEPKGLNIFPLIQNAAYDAAQGLNDGDCICVLSTLATQKSGKYADEIKRVNPSLKVVELGCPGFVEIVENRRYEAKDSYLLIEEKMKIVRQNEVKRIILGCTHYPYLTEIFKKFIPDDIYFNPAVSLAKKVSCAITNDGNANIDFYVTKNPDDFKKSAKLFFDIKSEVKCVSLNEFSLR